MKKIFAIVIAVVLLVVPMGHALAAEDEVVGRVYSADHYGGFDLSWVNNGEQDLLISAAGANGTISFSYDANGYRVSKTSPTGETTYFAYDEAYNLNAVLTGTHRLDYIYDAERNLTEIIIDGVSYSCELDDTTVKKLIDSNGNAVVEYVYDEGRIVAVYGLDEEGNQVDKTNDSSFVGNLNRVTYNAYYLDDETGWYYCGRYCDVENDRFVDGVDISVEQLMENVSKSRSAVSLNSAANDMYWQLLRNTTFGYHVELETDSEENIVINHNWVDGMSTFEILARLIYGESPYVNEIHDDRRAVAWTLWNRKMSNDYYVGGSTLRGLATGEGQYLAIWNASYDARTPNTRSAAWKSSVLFACYLYYAETLESNNATADLEVVMERPNGITAQHTYSCSYHSTMCKLQNGYIMRDAVLAGYGSIGSSVSSFTNAYANYVYLLYDQDIEIESYENYLTGSFEGRINVFYTHLIKPEGDPCG